jgi:carboxypeptidase C (cathepsin A)
MGLLGPRRVVLEEDGGPLPPPYKLTNNEYSLLDETDLVFIDPVSTGYSRATKPEDAKKFHGVREDVASVAEFIRLYITRNKRWPSPKFIIGESYGTTARQRCP